MKYILIALLFISCKNFNGSTDEHASVAACDSLQRTVDSLKRKLFVANFKVERVRYYLDIVENKPSQSKFLKGWIIRAVDEEEAPVQPKP